MAAANRGIDLALLFREEQMAGSGTNHGVDLCIDGSHPLAVFPLITHFHHVQLRTNGHVKLLERLLASVIVGGALQGV